MFQPFKIILCFRAFLWGCIQYGYFMNHDAVQPWSVASMYTVLCIHKQIETSSPNSQNYQHQMMRPVAVINSKVHFFHTIFLIEREKTKQTQILKTIVRYRRESNLLLNLPKTVKKLVFFFLRLAPSSRLTKSSTKLPDHNCYNTINWNSGCVISDYTCGFH